MDAYSIIALRMRARGSLTEPPPSKSPYQTVLDVATSAIAEGRIAPQLEAESAWNPAA